MCTFWKFCSAYCVNICSVNLGRETTFLTLITTPLSDLIWVLPPPLSSDLILVLPPPLSLT